MNLKHSTTNKILSTAAQPRPVEAQYQDEFYRSFCKLAGRGVPISTEWARTNSGRVDFFIPEKKWAVELLREYDRVDDHIRRFQKGGQYFQWLEKKDVDDWIVINCATSVPTSGLFASIFRIFINLADKFIVHDECRLFHAIFLNDFTELHIFNHKKEILCGPICLTN